MNTDVDGRFNERAGAVAVVQKVVEEIWKHQWTLSVIIAFEIIESDHVWRTGSKARRKQGETGI